MGAQMIAIVAEGRPGRTYVNVAAADIAAASVAVPSNVPPQPLDLYPRSISIHLYGLDEWWKLFTPRQLVALTTFSDLLRELRPVVEDHARAAGLMDDGVRLRDDGAGVTAYTDAVITYLAFAVDRCADLWSSIATWINSLEAIRNTFARQAIPMTWDYAEGNPFSKSSGNWLGQVAWVKKVVAALPGRGVAGILQHDASGRPPEIGSPVVCTDPPYYDNVGYANLSDFFYVWLRGNVGEIWPDETATLLTPKAEEIIANSYRAGSKEEAKKRFEDGMAKVFRQIAAFQNPRFPATVFYAYKQQETGKGGTASTGWETFLQGLIDAGLLISATWPVRTERQGKLGKDAAMLASSVVIACRPRPAGAPLATRRELLDVLQSELPAAVRLLQDEAIAPVDMAQSAIGPGMEVFSRYAKVLEADGTQMRVGTALALINEALEETLSSEETEFDGDTRWALTWYEQFGDYPGPFGDAETLSKAKNTSVAGVVQAGIAVSKTGRVRLITRTELDEEWDPLTDRRLTVWEVTQHLIARLDVSESQAADLLRMVGGGVGDRARRLAYLLYQIADRRGRSGDAVAYNTLIRSWHDIQRLATAGEGPVAQTFEGM